MGEAKPKCCGQVSPPGSYRSYNCGKNASLEHDGKHYCKLHHPPTVWAKRDARNAKLDAEWEEKKRRADAYDQLVERVKELEQTLRTIDGRLRQCFDDPITAREAYDSFYQEIVAAALSKARPNTAEGE